MKAFRGTLVAAVLLGVAGGAWLALRPPAVDPGASEGRRLFSFEKHELTEVHVKRTDGTELSLVEADGKWTIAGTDFVAGRSMVNRVKHQLHDLTARAEVVEGTEALELYGLGANATRVRLVLRSGEAMEFEAGDPNPSSVSYYIRPLPGDAVYTVKKSAVDYYSLTLDEFRERRFVTFDSNDVRRYEAVLALPDAPPRLDVEWVGEHLWQMHAPADMPANDDRVRRLLGRISALKASDFIEFGRAPTAEELALYGLDAPRARITMRFASRDPFELVVGGDAPSEGNAEELAYMMVGGDDTVFVARRGLLDEYRAPVDEFRNRRVVRMRAADVSSVEGTLRPEGTETLEGKAVAVFTAGEWFWADGVPYAGSTASRVAQQLAELEVEVFVADAPTDLRPFGLDNPVGQVILSDKDGNQRVVAIGGAGEPRVDPEGRSAERRYVRVEGDPAVYLTDGRVLSVLQDLIREGNRKSAQDADKAARRERIPSAPGEAPADAPGEAG